MRQKQRMSRWQSGEAAEHGGLLRPRHFAWKKAGWRPACAIYKHAIKRADFALGARLLCAQALRWAGWTAALEYLEALKIAGSQIVDPEEADELTQRSEPVIDAGSKRVDQAHKENVCDSVSGLLMQADWRRDLCKPDENCLWMGMPPMPLGAVISDTHSSQVVESIYAINNLAKAGHYRSAMEEALSALQHAPTYLPLHVQIGELLMQQNHLREATDKFSMIAKSYSARGDLKRAIHMLRRVIRVAPMDLVARNHVQLVERSRGEASKLLEMAEVYYNLADLGRRANLPAGSVVALPLRAGRVGSHTLQMADIDLQTWIDGNLAIQQIHKCPEDRAREGLVGEHPPGKKKRVEQNWLTICASLKPMRSRASDRDLESLSIEYPDQYFLKASCPGLSADRAAAGQSKRI
jgi:tetratricopeptide (TPR) repeat protein